MCILEATLYYVELHDSFSVGLYKNLRRVRKSIVGSKICLDIQMDKEGER